MKNIGDFLGLRRNILVMLAGVFALGTVCCALAPDIGSLIAARGVQGWAGGLVSGFAVAAVCGSTAPNRNQIEPIAP